MQVGMKISNHFFPNNNDLCLKSYADGICSLPPPKLKARNYLQSQTPMHGCDYVSVLMVIMYMQVSLECIENREYLEDSSDSRDSDSMHMEDSSDSRDSDSMHMEDSLDSREVSLDSKDS